MSGLLAPTLRETMLGNAQILEIFNVSKVGKIAGCRVTDGTVERGANVRLIRDNVVIHEGKLSTLKRFKDDAREVPAGQECGMAFELPGHAGGRRDRMLSRRRGQAVALRSAAAGFPPGWLCAIASAPRREEPRRFWQWRILTHRPGGGPECAVCWPR